MLRHAYHDALCVKTGGNSDGVLICSGTLRRNSGYGPCTSPGPTLKAMGSSKAAGEIVVGDILEVLPYKDPIPKRFRVPLRVPWRSGLLRKGEPLSHFRHWSSHSFPIQEVPNCVRVLCYMGLFKTEKPTGS